jgi:hypothetical protein
MTDASASPSPAAGSAVMASVAAAHFGHATAATARTFNGAHLTSIRFAMMLPAGKIVASLHQARPDLFIPLAAGLGADASPGMSVLTRPSAPPEHGQAAATGAAR